MKRAWAWWNTFTRYEKGQLAGCAFATAGSIDMACGGMFVALWAATWSVLCGCTVVMAAVWRRSFEETAGAYHDHLETDHQAAAAAVARLLAQEKRR